MFQKVMMSLSIAVLALCARPVLAAEPQREPVTVFLQEKYSRLDHPDFLMQRLEQEVMRVSEGDALTTLFAGERPNAPAYSFFREYSRMCVHPETGDTAFLGRHQWLNRGEWTLFILKADGQLWMPFPYVADFPLSGTEAVRSLQTAAMVDVKKSPLLECVMIREGKPPKQRSPKSVFSRFHRDLAWIPGTQNILYISHKKIYVFDLAKREIHVRNASHLRTENRFDLNYLNVARDRRAGSPFFLYHHSGVHRIGWDGTVTKMFVPDKGVASLDVFQKSITNPSRLNTDVDFQVLNNGAFFLIDNQVYNQEGRLLHKIHPKQSMVAFCDLKPLMVVSHKKLKEVRIMNLAGGVVASLKLGKRKVQDLSLADDGRFVAVQYVPKYPLVPAEFDVFQINGEKLIKVASDVLTGPGPAIIDGSVYYLRARSFVVLPIGGTEQKWGPLQTNVKDWTLKRGNEIVYATGSTHDLEGIERFYRNRFHHMDPPKAVPLR